MERNAVSPPILLAGEYFNSVFILLDISMTFAKNLLTKAVFQICTTDIYRLAITALADDFDLLGVGYKFPLGEGSLTLGTDIRLVGGIERFDVTFTKSHSPERFRQVVRINHRHGDTIRAIDPSGFNGLVKSASLNRLLKYSTNRQPFSSVASEPRGFRV